MTRFIIETPRLKLIAADAAMLRAAMQGDQAIGSLLGVAVTNPWTENEERVFQFSLDKIISHPDEAPWWTYFHVLKNEEVLTGTCGLKGKPDVTGAAEIGYEVAMQYRGKGLATEIAKALIGFAFTNADVKIVCAHTLPIENASVKVLRNCGFQYAGESVDEDVGKVWRWELPAEHFRL